VSLGVVAGLRTISRNGRPQSEQRYDVIVVGAGASGLAAAQRLQAVGYKTLTLEARDRIGGRIHTNRASATPLDLGASWMLGPRKNPVAVLLRQAGAVLRKAEWETAAIYQNGVKIGDCRDIDDFYDYVERQKVNLIDDESLLETLDRYIRNNNITGVDELILRHIAQMDIETAYGASMSNLSLKYYSEEEEFKGGDWFVVTGYDVLINGLSRDLDIRLRSPVDAIRDHGTSVTVSVGSADYLADYAIVTVPLGVIRADAIEFSPPLSKEVVRALNGLGMGNLHKTFFEFDVVFWDDVQTIDIMHDIPKWREFINLSNETGKPILLALHAGDAASEIGKLPIEQISGDAVAVLRTAFPNAPPPLRVTTTTWEDDPYSRGSYSFVTVGGSLEMRDTLAEPQGRVCFAGEHTNSAFPSTVHGAYRSGRRAADYLVGQLSRKLA
jgi:polyamine oxidase